MKINKFNELKFIYFLVMLGVIFLSVGYAAFNVSLNVEDIVAYVRVNKDIRITGFSVSESSDNTISSYEEYNYNKVSSLVILPNSDSSITYRIDITNFELAEMGIYDITGLPDNLEYSISEYTLRDKICDSNNKCNLGITKDIYLTIKYKNDGYDEDNTEYDLNLDLEFREIFDVTYNGIVNNSYPEYIMDSETLEIVFTEFIPYNVVLYVDGAKLDYDKYSYKDGKLIYNKVTGNVSIEYIDKVYLTSLSSTNYFKEDEYREKIKTISFVDYVDIPSDKLVTYDLSKNQDGSITGWIDKDYNLYVGSDFHIYAETLAYAFLNMINVEKIMFQNLNTSEVVHMYGMFWNTGSNVSSFTIIGLDDWDVSNITSMNSLFRQAGQNATVFDIGDLSKWNTSKVIDMFYMFFYAGRNAAAFDIGDLLNWDTSKATDMGGMFFNAGSNATTWNIGNLSKWNVSNVTNMRYMFNGAGKNSTMFNLGNIGNWNVSQVTDMLGMFYYAGSNATTWNIGDLSNWDTSQVTDMARMFAGTAFNSTIYDLGNLDSWDTSKVIDMSAMFNDAGTNATTWDIGNLSNWNTSQVTNMSGMFYATGKNATTWNIGDLSKWNTSQVTNMSNMFREIGVNVEKFNLGDLSGWDTSQVTDMFYMFCNTGVKATIWNVGDLSNWNTSNVTNMSGIFYRVGENATTFNIGDLSKWNTSKVTNMRVMFYLTGASSSEWSLDLSNWNVDLVTNYEEFNIGVENKIISPVWVN